MIVTLEADPFAKYAIFRDNAALIAFSNAIGYPLLPRHLHEILASCFMFLMIYLLVGPMLRNWPPFTKLSASKRAAFASHVVSEANAFILLILSFPLFGDRNLPTLVSYTPYSAFVSAVCSGYFWFDLIYTALWFKDNGWGFAIHAVASSFVFLQANRPFLLAYAAPYIWFEASTPFVNFHWLATNVQGVVSPKWETINGLMLMVVFFLCRVVAGPINGYTLFSEALFESLPGVPYWVVLVIFVCYVALSSLNIYWFGRMMAVAYRVLFGTEKNLEEVVAKESKDLQPDSLSPSVAKSGVRKRKV